MIVKSDVGAAVGEYRHTTNNEKHSQVRPTATIVISYTKKNNPLQWNNVLNKN